MEVERWLYGSVLDAAMRKILGADPRSVLSAVLLNLRRNKEVGVWRRLKRIWR